MVFWTVSGWTDDIPVQSGTLVPVLSRERKRRKKRARGAVRYQGSQKLSSPHAVRPQCTGGKHVVFHFFWYTFMGDFS
jgi:hypothetical protein